VTTTTTSATTTSTSTTSTTLARGLVAAYPFSEGTGITTADVSGWRNNGTLTGGPVWTTAGLFGNALVFDGFDDRVNVADANVLDLTTAMTLEAWVYPTVAPSGWRSVVAKEGAGGLVYFLEASAAIFANRPTAGVIVGETERDVSGGVRLLPNVWTHLATTYDGATLRLYVNGLEVANTPVTGLVTTSRRPLRIGGNSVFGEYFQGRIDEVRIYNRALSVTEILTDFATPIVR
jgi:hypothetical protein